MSRPRREHEGTRTPCGGRYASDEQRGAGAFTRCRVRIDERCSRAQAHVRAAGAAVSWPNRPLASGRAALAAAVLAFAACLTVAEPARGQTQAATVPAGWPLIPTGSDGEPLSVGTQFRLLFVTSSAIKGSSIAIGPYNAFVRKKAAGNAALATFSGKFSALISVKAATVQGSVDARDNTATTGAGVPIYWLNGAKAADDYADFYDGSWDSHAGRNEAGGAHKPYLIWTGSNDDGTKKGHGAIGTVYVTAGHLSAGREIDSGIKVPSGGSAPLYALSPVIAVVAAPTQDSTPPKVKLFRRSVGTQNAPFEIAINFDENVTGLLLSEIEVANGAASNLRGEGARYTVTVTPAEDTSGSLTVTVPVGAVTDAAGNANTEAAQLTVPIDTRKPRARITKENPLVQVTGAFDVTITFSERIRGFEATDLEVTNGKASNPRSPPNKPKIYVVTITPDASGTVIVHLPAGTVEDMDLARNPNVASNRITVHAKVSDKRIPPPTEQRVSADWPLIPKDSDGGPPVRFRLLFVTSGRYTHYNKPWDTVDSIKYHNDFVQRAASRNPHLTGFKGETRALISTMVTDARDNTVTTGTGVPIYWVDGERVADSYADFYDGSWASYAVKNELGADYKPGLIWTGSNKDGTKADDWNRGYHSAHRYHARVGWPADEKPIDGGFAAAEYPILADGTRGIRSLPLYGLSPVLAVQSPQRLAPTVTLNLSPDAIVENGGVSTVTAKLDRASSAETVVTVTATPDAPAGADDIRQTGTTLTIAAGEKTSTGTVTITAVDNAVDAPAKTATVSGTAANTQGVTGPEAVTLTIRDDDGETDTTRPTVEILPPEGAQRGSFRVTMVFSRPVQRFRLDDIAVDNGTAGDFTDVGNGFAETYSATITPGAGFRGTVTVSVPADVAADSDGLLNEASPPCPVEIVGLESPPPTPPRPPPSLKVTLGLVPSTIDENGGVSVVTARLDRASGAPTVVTVTAAPTPPAEAGDYRLSAEPVLTIPAGERESTGTVTVTAVDDEVDAPDKTVTVSGTARNAQGVAGPDPVTLTIVDDDETPTVTLALSRSSIPENGGRATVTVRQDRASSAPTVVRVRVAPAPPAEAGDYRLSAAPVLTVPAGERTSTGTVTIAAVDNAVAEPDKTVAVSGTARNAQGVAGPDPVTLTIEDDDAPGSRRRLNRVVREVLPRVNLAIADSALAAITDRLGSAPSCLAAANLAGQTSLHHALQSHAHALEDGSLRPEQVLSGTSFVVPLSDGTGPAELACLWGSGDYRAMAGGGDRVVRWDGDVFGARLGADVRMRDDILAGVAVSWSRGGVDWTDRGGEAPVAGTYQSRMTSVHPYVGWSAHEGLRLWATAGLGAGDIEIDDAQAGRHESRVSMRTAAAGARAELLADDRVIAGGTTLLSLRTEGLLARAAVAGNGWIDPLTVDTSRLRLTLEASHARRLAGGGHLTPMLEAGVRRDGGDGETGFGLELGSGLRYEDPALGLTAEGRVRVLATRGHDDEEWGIGGLVRLDPGADGTGWSFSLMPTWGETAGGAQELWDRGVAAAEAADRTAPAGRVETEVGYGLPAFDGGGVLRPYTGLSLTDESRDWLAGARFRMGALDADLSGSHARRASGESDYRVGVALRLPLGGGGSSGGSRRLEEQPSRPVPAQPAPESATDAPARAELGAASSTAPVQPAPGPVAARPPEPRAPEGVAPASPEAAAAPASAPRCRVQLGAYAREANAVEARTALSIALDDILVRAGRALVIVRSKGSRLSRVVVDEAFTDGAAAAALCAAIKARGRDCYLAPARRAGTNAPSRAAPGPASSSAPRWRVQLGAFRYEANAARTRTALSTALDDLLVRAGRALVIDRSQGGRLARVVTDDAFAERGAAAALCAAIKARGRDCYVAPSRR